MIYYHYPGMVCVCFIDRPSSPRRVGRHRTMSFIPLPLSLTYQPNSPYLERYRACTSAEDVAEAEKEIVAGLEAEWHRARGSTKSAKGSKGGKGVTEDGAGEEEEEEEGEEWLERNPNHVHDEEEEEEEDGWSGDEDLLVPNPNHVRVPESDSESEEEE